MIYIILGILTGIYLSEVIKANNVLTIKDDESKWSYTKYLHGYLLKRWVVWFLNWIISLGYLIDGLTRLLTLNIFRSGLALVLAKKYAKRKHKWFPPLETQIEKNKPFLVYNAIQTPDGTVLESHYRHDYKVHQDEVSGEKYMVDGGTDYTHRYVNDTPAKDLSVYSDAPFLQLREVVHRGARGKNGDKPLTWIPLCEISNDHLYNILNDICISRGGIPEYEGQSRRTKFYTDLYLMELEYRIKHQIKIEDEE